MATTRVETMLGDTAVAVHPADKRYEVTHTFVREDKHGLILSQLLKMKYCIRAVIFHSTWLASTVFIRSVIASYRS